MFIKKNQENKSELKELIGDFIVTFLLTFFTLIALAQVALNLLGFVLLNVKTGSMEPNYPINSLLFVKKTNPSEINKGDVITFVIDENGTLATHRVMEIDRSDILPHL